MATPAPPAGPAPARLGRALAGLGYTDASLRSALGAKPDELLSNPFDLGHLHRLESAPTPLATLIRLLLLGHPVEPGEADAIQLDDLAAHGLVEERDGILLARAKVIPYGDLLLASDAGHVGGADHVAAAHQPSATLAGLTPRRGVRTAVDIGTGNGIHALLCASHVEHVIATDVNERALAFAEFNAALNGFDNVEFRAGSLFDPVAGERYDLVVCNPPFVISPESVFAYRDSGMPGDAVSAQVVAELPSHLEDDGFGTAMLSWVANDEIDERPRAWLEGRHCDALLLTSATEDAFTSAFNAHRAPDVPRAQLVARIADWLTYYGGLGIRQIAYGAIVVHRRDGDNWFRSERLRPRRIRDATGQLERIFAAPSGGPAGPIRLVDGAYLDTRTRHEDGDWRHVDAQLRLPVGLGFVVTLDDAAALDSALDGGSPLARRLVELGFAV